jgi:PKD repeat protein
MVNTMHKPLIRLLLITLFSCLPSFASAATTHYTIHAEWDTYVPPSGYILSGFNLYQEGSLACQLQNPGATTMDCTVSLTKDSTAFSLTAVFSNGTESSHSAPFNFTTPDTPPVNAPVVNTTIRAEWDRYTPPNGYTLSGYNLYQDAKLACQSQSRLATAIDCPVTLNANTTHFTLTAAFSDGTESMHSEPFALTVSGGINEDQKDEETIVMNASFSTDTHGGQAPLPVSFDASASIGDISIYHWNFGDGTTGTGNTIIHTYSTPGTYTAVLTASNTSGKSSSASATITVTQPPQATPPTAVISSSTAAGQAPLLVDFNGSGSSATGGATITSYSWSFGDGTSASGPNVTRTFTTAGTFNTTLTVTDNKGLSNSTSTPIVVTAPSAANTPPTAVANATPVSGVVPLTVTFNGSGSTDADGTIESYSWNFGDGHSATGKTVTHTYTTAATFTATLQVIDNQGAKSATAVAIKAQAKEEEPAHLNMELGEISVGSKWIRVTLDNTYINPIVIAGPPSFNDTEPCVVRLRNVNSTGFDIRLTEWDYLDGNHPEEIVSYLVMEKGRFTLPDGSAVEAGAFTGTTRFSTVPFSTAFSKAPVVVTTITSFNQDRAISGRLRNIDSSGFSYYFSQQERNRNRHANETIHYIAWEPGKGTVGSMQFEAATTPNAVTHYWHRASFQEPFTHGPLLLADMQTTNEADPSALRMRRITTTGFQVRVEEEQSNDPETSHVAETVGYLAFSSTESDPDSASDSNVKTISAEWTNYTAPNDYTVTGFNLYQEETLACQTQNPGTTSMACTVTLTNDTTLFSLAAVFSDGSESPRSSPVALTVAN